ncbi:uncharacterized protein [Nicotiana sylvestris]|uniref:uncharacterized protein n=1 Tax=Nicotiana sylvestris TaxID=4096 RepID=UPI00388C3A08
MVRALHQGPWFINRYFLSLIKWIPNFVASKVKQTTSAVWVRLPQLPTEFYDGDILYKICNKFGHLLEVDACISATLRGRYARLCIEMSLEHPVKAFIYIGTHKQHILYEGDNFLCKTCGRLGHIQRLCMFRHLIPTEEFHNPPSKINIHTASAEEWQTVSFPRKRRSLQKDLPMKKNKENTTRSGINDNPVTPANPSFLMNRATSFVIWNVRGANNANFCRNFREIIETHKPCMVTLLETRMHDHAPLQHEFHLSKMIEIPAEGRYGGLVIMWMHNLVIVDELARVDQELHTMIKVLPNQKPWFFSALYASTTVNNRNIMWNNLEKLHETYVGPWLVGGDFNDVLMSDDKWGGRPINNTRASKIWNCINKCKLLDLGFKGCKYTWSNCRKRSTGLIMERLDRCFVNDEWLSIYPNAIVNHLPKTYSDHNPLLIRLSPSFKSNTSKPFRLETMWFSHLTFINIVDKCWSNKHLLEAVNYFEHEVTRWNNEVFGNIFHKKRRLLARLNGIQSSDKYTSNPFLQQLESTIVNEYNNVLRMEEDFWKLRSRINWLNEGDANTRLFHISTINRLRHNRITHFKDNVGNWIEDPAQPYVDELISPYQASFIKNRRASDNSIIIQEVISNFNKREGANHGMILKIDLEKAFDRLECSSNFGKYLGFPILSRHPKASDFQFFIDRMRSKLANWKISCLTMAGRSTLIFSTLSSIPNHVMQYIHLPVKILNHIDKIQRNFLWGTTTTKRKLHLVNWKTITKPKRQGGLGLVKTFTKNLTMLTCLAWRFFINPPSLWDNTLITQYSSKKNPSNSSFIWKNILKGWYICKEAITWEIGNGKNINFWNHRWILNLPPLRTIIHGPLTLREESLNIHNLWSDATLDLSGISFELPDYLKNYITSINIPQNELCHDRPIWSINANGIFTTKSTYSLIDNHEGSVNDFDWIWHLRASKKIIFFLWLCYHNRLPTRTYLNNIGINIDRMCPICKSAEETITHIFLSCLIANRFWNEIGINNTSITLVEGHWIDTVKRFQPPIPLLMLDWLEIFPFSLWNLWINRNNNNFNNDQQDLSLSVVITRAQEFKLLTYNHSSPTNKKSIKVKWHKPRQGAYKLNKDGAYKGNDKIGGLGGIIRNSTGDWIVGFQEHTHVLNHTYAELLALNQGLQLAHERKLKSLEVETDLMEVVNNLARDPEQQAQFSRSKFSSPSLGNRKYQACLFQHSIET